MVLKEIWEKWRFVENIEVLRLLYYDRVIFFESENQ